MCPSRHSMMFVWPRFSSVVDSLLYWVIALWDTTSWCLNREFWMWCTFLSRIIQPNKTHLSGDSCHATNAAAWAPHHLHWIFYDAQHLPFSHSAVRCLRPPTAHLRSVQSVDADYRWPHSYHRCYLLLALQCVKHRIKSLVRDMCVRRAQQTRKKNQNIKRNWSFPYLCNSRMETEPTLSSWCYSCRCFCYDELKCCLNYSYCHFQRHCSSRSRRRYFCW